MRAVIRKLKGQISQAINPPVRHPDDLASWEKFHELVRSQGSVLLSQLHRFPESILVAGCQRSGTTMLSRVFTQSKGMVDFWFGMDDELDAAQILSGWVHRECEGRYCFQTTFLNECYPEYFEREADFKLIWLLRNPQSVVYSMVYNWGDFAFDELYDSVGYKARPAGQTGRVSRLEKGCYSYNAKISQIFDIKPHLKDRVLVVDYDDLVARREKLLPQLYDFVGLAYDPAYVEQIHTRSVNKAERLSDSKKAQINELCGEAYERCRSLIDLT